MDHGIKTSYKGKWKARQLRCQENEGPSEVQTEVQ